MEKNKRKGIGLPNSCKRNSFSAHFDLIGERLTNFSMSLATYAYCAT